MTFLVADAMLGWPHKMYDASWQEWGDLINDGTNVTLAADSPWRTDCGVSGATTCTGAAVPVTDNGNFGGSSGTVAGACSYASSASATNDNDKQICATGIQTTDCSGNIN